MGKIFATIGEKIKMGMETAIGACIKPLIKLGEWLKRVKNCFLNKLLVKISSLDGYTQQLEERMKELGDSLPSEKGKDAKVIFDFISKTSKEDLEKIAILAETAKSIEEKDLRAVFEFISKSYREDLEKITTFVGTTRSIQEKDAEVVLDFISKAPKEKLERVAKILGGELEPEKMEEKIKKMRELGLIDISEDDLDTLIPLIKKIIELNERGKIDISKDDLKKIIPSIEKIKEVDVDEKEFKKIEFALKIAKVLARDKYEIIEMSETLKDVDTMPLVDLLSGIIDEVENLKLTTNHFRGIGLLKRGAYKEACKCFEAMIDTDQGKGKKAAWLNKCVALGCLGKIDEEIGCYDKALDIDPEYEKALENRTIAKSGLGLKQLSEFD